jgi:aryl-alcohol dehydrogenase-like predicted oxidoreductase
MAWADATRLLGCAAVARLGRSDLDVFGLCLGGNVFGWTADEAQSFEVLDAYVAAGGNFIDSSDSYSAFAPGNQAGESETVLGNWFAARGNRADVVLATKVGRKPDRQGLPRENIQTAGAESLERLQSDYIDLYYAHADDPDTPLEETLRAFDELVQEGKVRHIAASNYSGPRLAEALEISDREGLARYVALDRIAESRQSTVAAVALAWVRARPAVLAPIASAGNPQQLDEILPGATLELSDAELSELGNVSTAAPTI